MEKSIFLLIIYFLLTLNCSQSAGSTSKKEALKPANVSVTDLGNTPTKRTSIAKDSVESSISLAYIMGKFEPIKHPDFVKVAPKYANGRKDRLLRKKTYQAFLEMHKAAKSAGIDLQIISATRNFAIQKIIWEGKWTGTRLHESKENLAKTTPNPVERALKILKWSSMPGTSRHHWGTDIDLNALTNAFFEKGEGLKIYTWLTNNAAKYGFCQPYSPKDSKRPNGYNEEKWHWSYMPIALPLSKQAKLRLKDNMVSGFKGSETAQNIGVVEKFILGINQACL